MMIMLLPLLVLAGPANATASGETLFDQMITAKTCRTGRELGLNAKLGTAQTTYCRFVLKGLNLAVAGVGEEHTAFTVEELDPKLFQDIGFAPFQACVSVTAKESERGVAIIHIPTAKVFKTMHECRSQK